MWSYMSAGFTNRLTHITHGNIHRKGYHLASWNCGRGLLLSTEAESSKFTDLKLYIEKYEPHLFAVIESDIHGSGTTAANRVTTFSTQEIKDCLSIDGYNLEMPNSWDKYDQARIIVYTSDKINVKKKKC